MIVITPDRRQQGTNMLLIDPPDLLTFSFGEDSFTRHCALAEAKGAKVIVHNSDNIALDLDVPEDYVLLNSKISDPVIN